MTEEGSAATDNTGDGVTNDNSDNATSAFLDTIQNEELRGNEFLSSFDSPDSLAEGCVTLLNSQPKTPESIDEYSMEIPEGADIDEADFNSFRETALSQKFTKEQWEAAVQYDMERSKKWAEEDARLVEEATNELKESWKEKFEENITRAADVMKKLGFEDLGDADFVRANPRFAQFLHLISTKISEDKLTPRDDPTIDNRDIGEDGKPLLNFPSMDK